MRKLHLDNGTVYEAPLCQAGAKFDVTNNPDDVTCKKCLADSGFDKRCRRIKAEELDKCYYRYEDANVYKQGMKLFGKPMKTAYPPTLLIFKVVEIKEQRLCIVCQDCNFQERWIKINANRPKYRDNKDDALRDYIIRKERQHKIIEDKLDDCQLRMREAKALLGEEEEVDGV